MPSIARTARKKSRAASTVTAARLLKQGQVALTSGAWRAARDAFTASTSAKESAEALEGLGAASWWLDDSETVFQARERAYELYRRRTDIRAAARIAIELAEDHVYFRGEAAVARGWLKRAQRLLQGQAAGAEHAWLKLIEGDFALSLDNDPASAHKHAVSAGALARRQKIVDLEMLALALEGLSLVSTGNVSDGMPRLDEAAAAAVSGEMRDPQAIGYACCYLISACDQARDYSRAVQWGKRVERFCKRMQLRTLFSVCRVKYASILVWHGAWRDADVELRTAVRNLAPSHPGLQLDGLVQLAELRRRQGRSDEALELLKQAAEHPRALLGRAALAIDRADFETAAALAKRFLRQTPKENRVERLPGLDLLLRAELARGNRKLAETALKELRSAAKKVSTPALLAVVRHAEGLMAAALNNPALACAAFEDTIDLYTRSGAPFERARAGLELARSLFARGYDADARDEAQAAFEIFQRLGAARERRLAETLLRTRDNKEPDTSLSRREVEVLRLLAQGLSNAKIGKQLTLSEFTIKRHVANILTKLNLPSRAAAAAYAARQGLI